MYFKLFTLSASTEKEITKAGYFVNSYDEINVYNNAEMEFAARLPKDYIFKGDVWEKFDSSEIYERTCLLARTPLLPFERLWDLMLTAQQKDDFFGSIILMQKKYPHQLRQNYIRLLKNNPLSSAETHALKELSRII